MGEVSRGDATGHMSFHTLQTVSTSFPPRSSLSFLEIGSNKDQARTCLYGRPHLLRYLTHDAGKKESMDYALKVQLTMGRSLSKQGRNMPYVALKVKRASQKVVMEGAMNFPR